MSREITVAVPYRKGGEKLSVEFKIDFVSNRCNELYSKITLAAQDVTAKWGKMSDCWTEIAALEKEQPDGYKELIDGKKNEIEDLTLAIMKYKGDLVFDSRYELINRLLIANGVKDEELLSREFWDECVDPYDIMNFLTQIFLKDVDIDKKKAN